MGINSKEVQARADAKRAAYTGRNWTFLFYQENAPEDWLQQLTDLHIPMFISPLHDCDRFTKKDEEQGYERAGAAEPVNHLKKPHRHVLLKFSNAHFSYKKLKDICDIINMDAIELGGRPWIVCPPCDIAKVSDFRAYARYLCHFGTRGKTVYDPKDVIALGGLDYTRYAVNDDTHNGNRLEVILKKVLDELYDNQQAMTADDAYRYVLRAYPHEGSKLVRIYGHIIAEAGEGNYLRSLANSKSLQSSDTIDD